MKAFLVGLVVIILMGVLSVVGILLFPLLLLLGIFLRLLFGVYPPPLRHLVDRESDPLPDRHPQQTKAIETPR